MTALSDAIVAAVDGFRNEALRTALQTAATGSRDALESLLTRYSGLPGPTPNLKLAQAFGAEVALLPEAPTRLLAALGDDPSPIESPRVFLPVAAAYGWTARCEDDRAAEAAWQGLLELAADSRRPVRLGVVQALQQFASRNPGADRMLARASEWLELEGDPHTRFAASATALEVLIEAHVLGSLSDAQAFLAYVTRAIDVIADASRAAERLEGRRRLLATLVQACAAIVKQLRAAELGANWLAAECERAKHPDVRAALSDALLAVAKTNVARGTVERLRKILESSAKPLRDAARVRPGTGRGKKTRSIR